ncbi:MAG: AraC family ligand binding domain-containing protein, partial [Clostridia bacterium]|nr:AraC family ligand binding domain-containing protein [Clostridia bacterium]
MMQNKFTPLGFEKLINVEKIYTVFYMELSKHFSYGGEQHDFWEMVYIDKGEMLCTVNKDRFVLKSGEIVFHKPNEFHNHTGNDLVSPNVSIISFESKSRAMKNFDRKIFKLTPDEKALLSQLFSEALSCYRMTDLTDPLTQKLEMIPEAPFGSSQLTKNLLEQFLIRLCRKTDAVNEKLRRSFFVDGIEVPYEMKKILDYLSNNVCSKLTVSQIAKANGKSESALKQLFARYRKDGVIHCFNLMKINEAKRLIKEDTHNMSQIAEIL